MLSISHCQPKRGAAREGCKGCESDDTAFFLCPTLLLYTLVGSDHCKQWCLLYLILKIAAGPAPPDPCPPAACSGIHSQKIFHFSVTSVMPRFHADAVVVPKPPERHHPRGLAAATGLTGPCKRCSPIAPILLPIMRSVKFPWCQVDCATGHLVHACALLGSKHGNKGREGSDMWSRSAEGKRPCDSERERRWAYSYGQEPQF